MDLLLNNKIKDVINEALLEVGKKAFSISQETAPYCTGELKRSGLVNEKSTTMLEIRYDAPHAAAVEYGRDTDISNEQYTVTVPAHTRRVRTKNGRINNVLVKEHTKTFVGVKPILCEDGQWRTVHVEGPKEGRFFLTKAIQDVFKKALGFNNGLYRYSNNWTIQNR